jgi:metal-sulfur cluster biosynthetic enzyme
VEDTANLWDALKQVHDPEFPMSLVDLGLDYGITTNGDQVNVQLTFTAMGCPAMEMILDDIRARLLQEPGVRQVEIEIMWDPPWTSSRLSARARELMRGWGIAV